ILRPERLKVLFRCDLTIGRKFAHLASADYELLGDDVRDERQLLQHGAELFTLEGVGGQALAELNEAVPRLLCRSTGEDDGLVQGLGEVQDFLLRHPQVAGAQGGAGVDLGGRLERGDRKSTRL